MHNPFFYGNPAPPDLFIGRHREVRRVVNRIVNQGQSTAIIGERRTGKTSLLSYLSAPETREELYGKEGKNLFFLVLDAQALGAKFDQAKFWEHAFQPFYEQIIKSKRESLLAQAYETCQGNDFSAFVLERFLAQSRADGWRLVLLLDEFDNILHHPVLNSAEFFGSLRSVVSRSKGALALVIASRRLLENLNMDTQELSRSGSPYFNFFDEIILGPLTDKEVSQLLSRAGDRFTADDRHFVIDVGGGHPYLLQLAAAALWDAYEDHDADSPEKRRKQAGASLHNEASLIMNDTWHVWSPPIRKAFTAVGLAHIPFLLKDRTFYVERIFKDVRHFEPELRLLEKQGFVAEDANNPGGWRIRPAAFIWWLADEVRRTVRDDKSFEAWLQDQKLDMMLTKNERQQISKAAHATADLLKGGVKALIEAAGKGFGEGIVK